MSVCMCVRGETDLVGAPAAGGHEGVVAVGFEVASAAAAGGRRQQPGAPAVLLGLRQLELRSLRWRGDFPVEEDVVVEGLREERGPVQRRAVQPRRWGRRSCRCRRRRCGACQTSSAAVFGSVPAVAR